MQTSVTAVKQVYDPKATRENGYLARVCGNSELPLSVLKSAAGYYLGTRDSTGAPCTRESVEYWPTENEARTALKIAAWTQRVNP